MSITFEQNGKQGKVVLEGDLTLFQAEDLRNNLIKALIDGDEVSIAFGEIAELDLSCLQLFCSAHRSATRMNKRLFFSTEWPARFKEAVYEAGYGRFTGCRLDLNSSCLWTKS